MNEKTKNTLIVSLLSALFLGFFTGFLYFNKLNQDIMVQKHNIHPEGKLEFYKEVLPSEVDEFQKKLSKDIDLMIQGEKDSKFATKEGAGFTRKLFIVTGKPPVNQEQTKHQRAKYYEPFTYKFSDFGIRATGTKSYEIVTDMEVKYGRKSVYERMLTFELDKDGKISGGKFYART